MVMQEHEFFLLTFPKASTLLIIIILMDKLIQLEVSAALLSWIAGFLTERQQAVKIGDKISNCVMLCYF